MPDDTSIDTTPEHPGDPSDAAAHGSVLAALEATLRSVYADIGPATVAIGRNARGAGVVVATDRVLTNAHNLHDRTTQVTFDDGRAEQATVLATDAAGDLAVLAVPTGSVVPVVWGDEAPGPGSVVFALDRSLRGTRVTFGVVSGTSRSFRGPGGRPIGGAVEHTATMGRGSSGGPLIDRGGRLIGVNTHRLAGGFYLARAVSDDLRSRVESLTEGRSHVPPRLGIAIAPAHVAARLRQSVGLEPRDGVLVRGVDGGSAAETAGLREGDLVVGAGDATIASPHDLYAALDRVEVGGTLVLSVVRGADELTVEVAFPDA